MMKSNQADMPPAHLMNSLSGCFDTALSDLVKEGVIESSKVDDIMSKFNESINAGLSLAVKEHDMVSSQRRNKKKTFFSVKELPKEKRNELRGIVDSYSICMGEVKVTIRKAKLHVTGYGTVNSDELLLYAQQL